VLFRCCCSCCLFPISPGCGCDGKVLYAYPLLLIPNLLFIIGVYALRPAGSQALIWWGIVSACAINDLLRRVIFDSSYQLLMFSIPENLSNAIRLYSKLFFKPVFIIGICAVFLMIPELNNPIQIYTILIILSLTALLPVIYRIPKRYALSLRKGIQRRSRIEDARGSLINYKTNLIIDEYKMIRAYHDNKFNYLYLLNLIGNNYTPDLDNALREMLAHKNGDVRLKTVALIHQLKATHLVPDLEKRGRAEEEPRVKQACLRAIATFGPSKRSDVARYLNLEEPLDLLRYNLTIVHRWGSDALKETAESYVLRLLNSEDDEEVLTGIWLVGELKLAALKGALQGHFNKHGHPWFAQILDALSKMEDIDLFQVYLEAVGFENIRDYAALNQYLARFEGRAFDVIFDMLIFMTRSKSYLDLEKCLRTLRLLPSQDTVDFLVDTLFRFPNPHVKREALLCINRMRKADQDFNFDELVERLPEEIHKCRDLCTDYQVIALTRPNSLVLLELARNIETQIWMIFQILDLLNPQLKVMDTFFRIKWFSHKDDTLDHTRAKSIEYLEVIMQQENIGILRLLDAIRFDDGLFYGTELPANTSKDVKDVYRKIFQGQDYWLKLAAVWDHPLSTRGRFETFFREVEAMMPLLERAHLVKDSPMLKGLSMMELTMFAEFMEIVDFPKHAYVFQIGDPANALYQIIEGKAELLDEAQTRVDLLEAPISIGYGFIIQKSVRRYAMKCIDDCRMIKISRDGFSEILELNPRIYKNIFEILLTMVDKDVYRL
jgi:hypothetical protein